jgi:hypothetical protein
MKQLRFVALLAALAVLVSLASSTPLPAVEDDPGPDAHPHREVMRMPPAETRARDDLMARSPGLRVTVGPYTSIQANVDEFGMNIIGDAANEPSIAVNPTNPNHMAIGWRQFDSISSDFRQAGYAYTWDGGETWTFPGVLTPGTFRSDPVLDFDSDGSLYYQSLQLTFELDVFKSEDGGESWGSPVFAYGGDKNWMVIDRSGGIGDGNLYAIWQALVGCCDQDHFNRSTDGGQSFEYPVGTWGSPGMGTLAVGPEGEVYAAGIEEIFWQEMNTIVFTRSLDAQDPGATPTFTGVEIPFDAGVEFSSGPNPAGLLGQVNVVVDHSFGPGRGYIYVLASLDRLAAGTNPTDVMFSRSEDGGSSWSDPIRVNDDASNGGAWHWLAAVSVSPGGRLDAIWADTRNSGQSNISELFYSYSWDHGDTWSANIPVSPSFNSHVGWPQQSKIGDYYTIISDATGAHTAYSATFNGEQDVYYIRLFPDCNNNGVADAIDIHGPSADCNANHIPDECEENVECGPAGATPDGRYVWGSPLTVDKTAGAALTLTWGGSCLDNDTDYGIYEGTIGDYASHTRRLCSTGGQFAADLLPSGASSYYLVVPQNATNEGSYGRTSGNVERPAGVAVCMPQEIGHCQGSVGGGD